MLRSGASAVIRSILRPHLTRQCASKHQPSALVSTLPTSYYQDKLPQLPLPDLNSTLDKYTGLVRGLNFDAAEVSEIENLINKFRSEGKDLQDKLEKYNAGHPETSYVANYWNDMYLMQRDPLMFNSSVGTWDQENIPEGFEDPAIRATNLIVASVEFMQALQSESLEPYYMAAKPNPINEFAIKNHPVNKGGQVVDKPIIPFCMSQFKHMFQGTRIPCKERDQLELYPKSKHVVIMKNGHFFSLDVLDGQGKVCSGESILQKVRSIQEKPCPYPEYPVSVLTADNRDFWTDTRKELIENGNAESVEAIDSAIMLLVLDDAYENLTTLLRASLHGNGANRWFDKPYNFVVCADGQTFSLMEHSWGDGIAGVYMKGWTKQRIAKQPAVGPDSTPNDNGTPLKPIEFNLNDSLKSKIVESKSRYDTFVASMDFEAYKYDGYGGSHIKSKKLSPDCVSQVAFQLAYHKLYQTVPNTYESCTTALFKHGRTETVRPVTDHSTAFCRGVLKGQDKQMLLEELRKASSIHTKRVADATFGQGSDRHMFALFKLAQSLGGQLPELFTHPSFLTCMSFILSTSTMGSHSVGSMAAFAPVSPKGFGIYYLMANDGFGASISSYRPHNEVKPYTDALSSAFDDIRTVIDS